VFQELSECHNFSRQRQEERQTQTATHTFGQLHSPSAHEGFRPAAGGRHPCCLPSHLNMLRCLRVLFGNASLPGWAGWQAGLAVRLDCGYKELVV